MSDQELTQIRLGKLQRLRELGHDPYLVEKHDVDFPAQELLERFDELQDRVISFAGRVVAMREMGKAAFAHLSDGESRIQIYVRKDVVGDELWEVFKLTDLGDHLGVTGTLFLTKTGEKSIQVTSLTLVSKCLHALPLGKEKEGESWGKLADVEQRYRNRHLDLITNPEARTLLLNRCRITAAVRRYFDNVGYLEVETPMLQLQAGGAAARPFMTHYNAYDLDVKLRISLELYLKRIICGDVPRVYEIGRVFRNEGVSNRHSPEFTMLEFYEAWGNLETMMQRVEECFKFVGESVFKSTQVTIGDLEVDFGKPWQRVDLLTEIERHTGLTAADLSTLDSALQRARELDVPAKAKALDSWIDLNKENNLGGFIEKLLEVFVEPTLQQPTFVVGYPIETSPLAKKDPSRPGFTRRFEGYIRGKEVCNAFSEINDPIDQRERFEDQLKQASAGNDEAHPMDEDFLFALECGMPPTGGCGIGIDRMAMMLTGAEHIREILLFPMMKPD